MDLIQYQRQVQMAKAKELTSVREVHPKLSTKSRAGGLLGKFACPFCGKTHVGAMEDFKRDFETVCSNCDATYIVKSPYQRKFQQPAYYIT